MLWSWGSSSSNPTWDPLGPKLGFGFHEKNHPEVSAFAGNPAFYKGLLFEGEKTPKPKWLLGKSDKWEADGRRGCENQSAFAAFPNPQVLLEPLCYTWKMAQTQGTAQ